MNRWRQIFIFLILFPALFLHVSFPFLIIGNNHPSYTNVSATIFDKQISSYLKDNKGDAKLVALYNTKIVPEVKDYHDILSAYVSQTIDDKIQLTIDLAGDANQNENYETVYLWLIYFRTNPNTGYKSDQLYTIIVPNFATKSRYGNMDEGWYLAIFNNTDNSYTLNLSKISDMPKGKVQVFIDPLFIGRVTSIRTLSASIFNAISKKEIVYASDEYFA